MVCGNSGALEKQRKSSPLRRLYSHLNKSVLRERHMLPAVDEAPVRSASAKVFSKLDARWEFWQIPLEKNQKF